MCDLSTNPDKELGVEIGRFLVINSRSTAFSNEVLEFITRLASIFLSRNHMENGTPSMSSSKHVALMTARIELSKLPHWVDSLLNGSLQSSAMISEKLTL